MRERVYMLMLSAVFLVVITTGPAMASRLIQEDGILPNHSADYVRTLNRFASTDPDAAFYNPAGLAFMKKRGLYIDFSSQTMSAERVHTMDYYGIDVIALGPSFTGNFINPAMFGLPDEYKASVLAPVLPGLDIVWKGKDYAVYFNVAVMQSAPGMKFDEGLAIMDWGLMALQETFTQLGMPMVAGLFRESSAERTEYFIGGTLGAAYKIQNWLSAAVGLRYINISGNQNVTVKYHQTVDVTGSSPPAATRIPWQVDTSYKGHEAGIIIGLHFKPIDMIDIGLKYEYYLPVTLQKKTNKFQIPPHVATSGSLNEFIDGWEKLLYIDQIDTMGLFIPQNMNIDKLDDVGHSIKFQYPQTIAAGFSVNILKNLRAESSGEITLRKYAQMEDNRQKDYEPLGYKVGQCLEWTFIPKYTVSVGWVYNDFGIKPSKRSEADQLLTSHTVGAGFKFNLLDWLDLTVGGFYVIYKPETVYPIEYTNVTAPTLHFLKKTLDEKRFSISVGLTGRFFGEDAPGGSLVSN